MKVSAWELKIKETAKKDPRMGDDATWKMVGLKNGRFFAKNGFLQLVRAKNRYSSHIYIVKRKKEEYNKNIPHRGMQECENTR